MKLRRHELHELTGAYALDALPGPELDRFERHLGHCPPCGNEVRGFRETATQLAVAVAADPPATLKWRVLAAVRVTRQLPPEVAGGRRPGRRGWVPRLATGLAAAGVAVAVLLAVLLGVTRHQLDQARAQNRAVAAVLAAPDARLATRATSAGGVATVVAAQSRRALIISTSGLPTLTGGKVYELWFLAPSGARRAGLLPAGKGGKTPPLLASGLLPGDSVALTVEPAGGTNQPTTKPIVVVPLR
ncbi:MAG TPA: anti-sigma factor [Streptosporangiaceae bacterium]|nr:anti-sigma factor [Streptosporangiaceae bacterium]